MALNLPPLRLPKLVLPIAGIVVALGLMLALGRQVQQLKDQLAQGQRKIEELSSRNQELTQRLEALQTERRDLDTRVSSLSQQLTSASTELTDASDGFRQLQDRFTRLSEEKAELQSRVTMLTEQREEHVQRLDQLAHEKSELEQSVARLRERLAFLDRDYQQIAAKLTELESTASAPPAQIVSVAGRDMPEQAGAPDGGAPVSAPPPSTQRAGTVELPPIIVRKDQAGTSLPVRGRLVEVNEPHRFIVLDKGSTDGVRVGMAFDILRGAGTVIGRATAVRVRPQLAALDIQQTRTSEPLQVGDLAVQSTP